MSYSVPIAGGIGVGAAVDQVDVEPAGVDAVAPVWSHRPGAVLAIFPRTAWGQRGYDAASVDAFSTQVAHDRAAADDEIADLRTEVDRLHRYIRRQWAAVAAAEAASDRASGRPATVGAMVSPAAQARAVLSQAQDVAEQMLSEARSDATRRRARALPDSNRLLLAWARYQDIVVRAHQRADRAAELALAEFQDQNGRPAAAVGGDRARAELEVKAAYLRTFAKVSRVALHAALDLTAREFDRLLGASASNELEPG